MNDKQGQKIQTAIRLSGPDLERADRLIDPLSQPGLQLTRADILRMAVNHGLDHLEAQAGKRKR